MGKPTVWKEVLARIAANTASEEDLDALRQALRTGQLTVATGEQAVAIGGSADGAVVTTGDGNIILSFQGADAKAIREIIGQIRLPFGKPFQVPPLPPYFVPRPEFSDELKRQLLAEDPAPGALVISAIHGLGGIGKSTLAAALAYDLEVQARFPDGILWATLGQQPDVLSLQAGWIQALGDYNVHPTTIETGTAHLRTLLHGKACLLVVDDAWEPGHVAPLLAGGGRSRVLVTTREAIIAKAVGAALYDLDVLTPEQAMTLLAGRLGRELAPEEIGPAAAVAKEVGYLPLALELAAAQVADGVPWEELLIDLQAEIAHLETLEAPDADAVVDEGLAKRLSLRASFELSLRRLSKERQWALAWLGLLAEDAPVLPAMAAVLWEADERTARDTLRVLRDRALLMAGAARADGGPAYRLHDLVRGLASWLLTAPAEQGGLGLTLPQAHAALLARYRARTEGGQWHTLPDDGYVHSYLAWHMEQAGQAALLHTLLREETPEGRNGWYEAHERTGQTASFLADLHRAWRLAGEPGLQCRYALVQSSLHSIAQSIPPEFMVALVEKAIWSPVQGLAYARSVLKPEQRAKALSSLASSLPKPLATQALRESLQTVQEMRGVQATSRSDVLISLCPYLPKTLLPEAVRIVWGIENKLDRARTLVKLLASIEDPASTHIAQEVLKAARLIEKPQLRTEVLISLVPYLSKSERTRIIREVLGTVRVLPETQGEASPRAKALAGLALYLPADLVEDALRVAYGVEDKKARSEAIARLIPRLTQVGYFQQAFEALERIECPYSQMCALTSLIPHLPESNRAWIARKAMDIAQGILDEQWRTRALSVLAPILASLGYSKEAVGVAQKITDIATGIQVMARLSSHLPRIIFQEVLAAVRELRLKETEELKAEALGNLFQYLPRDLVPEALEIVSELDCRHISREVIVNLVSRLAELGYLQEALSITQRMEKNWEKNDVLTRLSLTMAKIGRPQDALNIACRIEEKSTHVHALAGLLPHLPNTEYIEGLKMALETAQEMGGRLPSEALTSLVPFLEKDKLHKTLAAARQIGDVSARFFAAVALSSFLTETEDIRILRKMLFDALEEARVQNKDDSLTQLVPRLAEMGYIHTAREAVQTITHEYFRTRALISLLPHVTEAEHAQIIQDALGTARTVFMLSARALALTMVAVHLPEPIRTQTLEEAMETIQQAGDPEEIAGWIVYSAPHLPDNMLRELWGYARKLTSLSEYVAWALSGLAPYFPKSDRHQAIREALEAVRTIGEERKYYVRTKSLANLIPHLPCSERFQVLQEALETIREDVGRWRSRGAFADLAEPWAEWARICPADAFQSWSTTIRTLAMQRRSELLSDLQAFAPVVVAFGGVEAARETFRAIQDVGRWWP